MEHDEAVRLQAAVKYVLGELPQTERDSFEEHYFDCGECALEVRSAAAFVDNTRNVLRQEARDASLQAAAPAGGPAWFKPMVAAPVLAVLLMVVAYQNIITIPRTKQAAATGTGEMVTSVFSLQTANTRGGEAVKVRVHPNESFALKFDFTPARLFSGYVCQLHDESGRAVLQAPVPGTTINQEAQFVVPAGKVAPGEYSLVFTGGPAVGGQDRKAEVLRLRFAVEFVP